MTITVYSKKCKVLHLGLNNKNCEYSIEETEIKQTLNETVLKRDVGVLISKDLKTLKQCNKAAKEAMRTLRTIKRTFKNLNDKSFNALYC